MAYLKAMADEPATPPAGRMARPVTGASAGGTASGSAPAGGVLMEAGWIAPGRGAGEPVAVRRGMVVISQEGAHLGRVAAVLAGREDHAATHIVLGCGRSRAEYRLVPIAVIAHAGPDSVTLYVSLAALDSFPLHAPD